jgi:hypothetical protein
MGEGSTQHFLQKLVFALFMKKRSQKPIFQLLEMKTGFKKKTEKPVNPSLRHIQ